MQQSGEKKRRKDTKRLFFSDNFHMGVYFYRTNLRSHEEPKMVLQKSDQGPHPE